MDAYQDYLDLFGGEEKQAAEVMLNANRSWYRLVGLRHDMIEWSPPTTFEKPSKMPKYHKRSSESWIVEALEPVRKVLLRKVKLFQTRANYGDSGVAFLVGIVYNPGEEGEKGEPGEADDSDDDEGGLPGERKELQERLKPAAKKGAKASSKGIFKISEALEKGINKVEKSAKKQVKSNKVCRDAFMHLHTSSFLLISISISISLF